MKKLLFALGATVMSGLSMAQSGSFPLEANVGYLDFNDNVNYKDSWYVGGSSGFNFTDNAGVRGYYWRTLQEDFKLEKDEIFSNLEIYGAESKVAIPITKYTKPYLLVGGGLLKPFDGYKGEDGISGASSKFFGSAGAGLDINFVDFMNITGFARAMVMDFEQFDNLGDDNNKVKASWNYGGSINFLIGRNGITSKKKSSNNSNNIVMPSAKMEAERDYYKDLSNEREEIRKERREQKADYNERVYDLQREIERLETDLEINAIRIESVLPENATIKREELEDTILDIRKEEENYKMDSDLQKKYDDILSKIDAQEKEIERLRLIKNEVPNEAKPTTCGHENNHEHKCKKETSVVPQTSTKVVEIERPIPDFDHDGILNEIDKCPNVAGPLSNEGCPISEKKTKVVTKVVEKIVEKPVPMQQAPIENVEQRINFFAQSVFFDFDKATIKGASKIHMDEIYELMQQNPYTNYIVEGHTDSLGNADYNKELSRKRAQSVVNYLVNKGIPSSNLKAIGYGEEQPIADNSTKSGREKNRRVVIKLN